MNRTQLQIMFTGIYLVLGVIGLMSASWWILVFWLIFAFGNGTVGHRYFAHRSFSVSATTHWILALWCTLSAYSPPVYWQVQHRHHHRHTDRLEDIHSPRQGWLMSMFGWPFSEQRLNSVFDDRASLATLAQSRRDRAASFCSDWFIPINLVFWLILMAVDWNLLLAAAASIVIEYLRLGLINSVCHWPGLPGNYRNHDTSDQSYNNIVLGWVGLGFGWHNNHHHDASALVLSERWWEIDLEGQLGRLLAKL